MRVGDFAGKRSPKRFFFNSSPPPPFRSSYFPDSGYDYYVEKDRIGGKEGGGRRKRRDFHHTSRGEKDESFFFFFSKFSKKIRISQSDARGGRIKMEGGSGKKIRNLRNWALQGEGGAKIFESKPSGHVVFFLAVCVLDKKERKFGRRRKKFPSS